MIFVVKICNAGVACDAYARAGYEPEQDHCWFLAPPLAVRQTASGAYDHVIPDEVQRFTSYQAAASWKRRRIRYQRSRRRPVAAIRVLRVDAARLPLRVLEGL